MSCGEASYLTGAFLSGIKLRANPLDVSNEFTIG